MSSSSFRGSARAGAPVLPPLQRGKACIRCRRRKMRCDSVRPICGPCIQARREDDCEYTDEKGQTRTQLLEENIQELEARIRELEGRTSEGSRPNIALRLPYSTQSTSSNLSSAVWDEEYLPIQISDTLVRIFLQHAPSLGFAMDTERFQNEAGLPPGHPHRPHDSLLSIVYAWGIRFTMAPELKLREEALVQRSVVRMANCALLRLPNLDENASRKGVQAVQAEILLANYFFCLGQMVEGLYHSDAAVSVSMIIGLHRTGIADSESNSPSLMGSGLKLSPPSTPAEFGERVRIFWEAFNLDNCWNAALNKTQSLSDDRVRGTQIDIPWPLDSYPSDYQIIRQRDSGNTVQSFLSSNLGISASEMPVSISASRAKASAIYARAAQLSAHFESQRLLINDEIRKCARITTQFAQSLPSLDYIFSDRALLRPGFWEKLAVSHCLAHAAMLHLHLAKAKGQESSKKSDALINHAHELLSILDLCSRDADTRVKGLDPILALLGHNTAQILAERHQRVEEGARTHQSKSELTIIEDIVEQAADILMRCAGPGDIFPVYLQEAVKVKELGNLWPDSHN